MKILDVEQGTIEWMTCRLGIPTASQFDRILTPKTRKRSSQAEKYLAETLAEWLLGQPLDWVSNSAMERGTELEDEARRWYEFDRDVEVRTVGFLLRDDGLVGGSPDGLVGQDGILEIKTPMAVQHVLYMLGSEPEHIGQVQGYLYLSDRQWVDILSYSPELPPVVFRVERDEAYIRMLVPELEIFIERLEREKERWIEHRVPRPWSE